MRQIFERFDIFDIDRAPSAQIVFFTDVTFEFQQDVSRMGHFIVK